MEDDFAALLISFSTGLVVVGGLFDSVEVLVCLCLCLCDSEVLVVWGLYDSVEMLDV